MPETNKSKRFENISQALAVFLLSFILSNEENYTQMRGKVKAGCVRILDEFPRSVIHQDKNPLANERNRCTSLKFVTIPTEMRTAPMDLPSKHMRKSSWERRSS